MLTVPNKKQMYSRSYILYTIMTELDKIRSINRNTNSEKETLAVN